MQSKRKLNGAARAAAALIGVRIAAGDRSVRDLGPGAGDPPQWIADLDEYEADEELWIALHSPLGEMHKARIASADDAGPCETELIDAPSQPARRSTVAWFGRRGACSAMRR